MPAIILASKSPRRKRALEIFGFSFSVEPAHIDEKSVQGKSLEELARKIAEEKAHVIAERHPEDAVIGIDTMVCKDSEIMGQPESEEEAGAMLSKLLGGWHIVCSGYCIIAPGKTISGSLGSKIKLKEVEEKTIKRYIAGGHWKGKAGGYNIEEKQFEGFVEKVEGSKLNIVGFPAEKLVPLIEAVSGQKAGKTIKQAEALLFRGRLKE